MWKGWQPTSSSDCATADVEVVLVRDGDFVAARFDGVVAVVVAAAEVAAVVSPTTSRLPVTTPPYELYGCKIGLRSLTSSLPLPLIGPFCPLWLSVSVPDNNIANLCQKRHRRTVRWKERQLGKPRGDIGGSLRGHSRDLHNNRRIISLIPRTDSRSRVYWSR